MNFRFSIENLGNIEKAIVDIKPLTIIAGENGTGKSFATKSLYSILDTVNIDHAANFIHKHVRGLSGAVSSLQTKLESDSDTDREFLLKLQDTLDYFVAAINDIGDKSLQEQKQELVSIHDYAVSRIQYVDDYYANRLNYIKNSSLEKYITNIGSSLRQLAGFKDQFSAFITSELDKKFKENFLYNFQIQNLTHLIRQSGVADAASFNLDGIGGLLINPDNSVAFQIAGAGIDATRKLNNVVYIDSPAYAKVRRGLQRQRFGLELAMNKGYLKGYPVYLDKLFSYLDERYVGDPEFIALSEEISQLIRGEIKVSKDGEFVFAEEGSSNNVPLSLTAMGIANLGMIDLLIRNNIIKKGSFLIIDEPEAHLHPKWQVALFKIMYKMAALGANVVIATHSIDMIKAAEVFLKKDEHANDLMSVNKMPYDEAFEELDSLEKISILLEELSSPFYELYMDGI